MTGPRLPRTGDPPLVDVCLGLGLAAGSVAGLWVSPFRDAQATTRPDGVAVALALALTVPLVWRRERPDLVVSVVAPAQLGTDALGYPPGLTFLSLIVAIYSLALYRRPEIYVVPVVALLLAVYVGHLWLARSHPSLDSVFGVLVPSLVAWIVGDLVRARGRDLRALRERTRELEREREARAREAVAAERALIARELHDIVAHALGVIVVQAGGAGRLADRDPSAARQALLDIERTGRTAFAEMRRLVDVLRVAGQDELGPAPSLRDVPGLVRAVNGDRLEVTLAVHGSPRPVAPGVELSAYRVVQEALTNSLRHAAPTTVRVVVSWDSAAVQVEVVDTGPAPDSADAPRAAESVGPTGPGYGLAGMRERAAIFHGELQAGPLPRGGFRVWARFPTAGPT